MPKYILEFKKKGLIKYTSHLDMLRLFKRAFKTAGIPIEYSQGFNPHPKMGFAQPLSLGFTSEAEYLEFNTTDSLRKEIVLGNLRERMPSGIILSSIIESEDKRTLASRVVSAKYRAVLPLNYIQRADDIKEKLREFLAQNQIIAQKREKKTKKYVDKDIKNQIRGIEVEDFDGRLALLLDVDAGSASNINPEIVVQSLATFSEITLNKGDLEIERLSMDFME